jgi:DegV family protein with EDD domain
MTRPRPTVAVVTDSSAYLPDARLGEVTVVPLTVVIDGHDGREGIDVKAEDVARAMAARRSSITTSRPSPHEFVDAYGTLLARGYTDVVSVHISAELSGTVDAAELAAKDFGDRIHVVDSRSAGMGLGFPALAAADAAASGATATGVVEAARRAVEATTTFLYVDTLEFLRRGGRIGAASALVGTALSVKPILRVSDGAIVVHERVRTATRALARLVDLAVAAAGDGEVDLAVHHLAAPQRAENLLSAISGRLGPRLKDAYLTEIGAAVGAHVGPGMASVVVHRR